MSRVQFYLSMDSWLRSYGNQIKLLICVISVATVTSSSPNNVQVSSPIPINDHGMCRLISFQIDAANALTVRWSTDNGTTPSYDVISSTVCLLRLGITRGQPDESIDCDSLDNVVAEVRESVTAMRYTFWNVGKPGDRYTVCSRAQLGDKETGSEIEWSHLTADNKLRSPPEVDNCVVLIRGSRRTTAVIDMKPSYVYHSGNNVIMKCDVTGQPEPMVQWMKCSQVDCHSQQVINNGSQLHLPSATKANEGSYFLIAWNKYGRLFTEVFELRMAVVQPLRRESPPMHPKPGLIVYLPCDGWRNSVPHATVTWYRVIDRETMEKRIVELSNRTALVDGYLVFSGVQRKDSGTYICRVTVDELGDSEYGNRQDVIITDPDHINFRQKPEAIEIDVLNGKKGSPVLSLMDSTVQLSCLFTGFPRPNIEWFLNGRSIHANDSHYKFSSNNQVLQIDSVDFNDQGLYECIATNTEGSTRSQVRLQIFSVPSIISGPKSVNASEGETVTFECSASGAPPPEINWYLNGIEVNTTSNSKLIISGKTLTISKVVMDDVGVFQCKAANYYGYATSGAYLNVFKSTEIESIDPSSTVHRIVSFDKEIIQPVQIDCSAVTDPLTNITVSWNLAHVNTNGTCASVHWHLGQTVNSSKAIVNMTASSDLFATRKVQLVKNCCGRAECRVANGIAPEKSIGVQICWSPAASVIQSEAQLDDVSSNGSLTIAGIAVVVIIGCVAFLLIFLSVWACLNRNKKQQKVQRWVQPDHLLQIPHHMNEEPNGYVDGTQTRARRLGSTSSECSSGSWGRSTMGRGQTLCRQASAYSSAGSTDCLVRENCWTTVSPIVHLNQHLQQGINDMLIHRQLIRLNHPVGNGQFGRVFSAELQDPRGKFREHVAVKTMKFKPDEIEMVELFLREAVIMRGFRHSNVLNIIGVTFDSDGSPMVILPYMANGDLRQYILNPNLNITILELLRLGLQVAEGMNYLSSKRFVHRDLAARNCMVTERCIVKVADFGLSRELMTDYYCSTGNGMTPVPVRWLAPECLEFSVFTTMSDVWSYGVLLWELMTRGNVPYSEVDNWQIAAHVQAGNHLERPEYCPEVVYNIMLECWNQDSLKRPTFSQLVESISGIISSGRPGTRISSALYQNVHGRARSSDASAKPADDRPLQPLENNYTSEPCSDFASSELSTFTVNHATTLTTPI